MIIVDIKPTDQEGERALGDNALKINDAIKKCISESLKIPKEEISCMIFYHSDLPQNPGVDTFHTW